MVFNDHPSDKRWSEGSMLLPCCSLPYTVHTIPTISFIGSFLVTAFCRVLSNIVLVRWRGIFRLNTFVFTCQLIRFIIVLHHRRNLLHLPNHSKSFLELPGHCTFALLLTYFPIFPNLPHIFSTHDRNKMAESQRQNRLPSSRGSHRQKGFTFVKIRHLKSDLHFNIWFHDVYTFFSKNSLFSSF